MVQVVFGARTQELEDGAARARAAIESVASPAEEAQRALDGLNEALKGLNETTAKGSSAIAGFMKVIGGGAAGLAVAGLLEAFHKTSEEMGNLKRNAEETGLTLERFQQLKYAADLAGLSADKFVGGLQEAGKRLNDLAHGTSDLSKFLDANNVRYEDANGKLISTDRYFEIAAQLVRDAATEGDRFKIAEIMGFSREWVRVLQGGPAALERIAAKAKEAGAVLDREAIDKADAFAKKWKESSTKWEGYLKGAIVNATPYVDAFIGLAGKLFDEVKAKALGSIENIRAIANSIPAAQRLQESFAAFETESSQTSRFWQQTLLDIGKLDALMKGIGEGNFFPAKGTRIPEKEDKDALRAALEEMRGAILLEDTAFRAAQEHAASSLRLFGMTEGQKTAFLLAELAKRQDLELAAVAKASEIETDSLAAKQRVVNESLLIEARYLAERQRIIDQAKVAEAAAWESMLKPVQGAWDSQLRGLLAGTTTWAQATKNIVADLVLDAIRWLETLLVRKAAVALASTVGDPAALAGNLRAIGGDLGQAYAGFTAFLAPMLGPAAPEVAAGLTAAVGATATSLSVAGAAEGGAWEIPATSLWMLHPGETVLPAAAAEGFRSMAERGGGGGDVHVHLNVAAHDTQTGYEFVKRQLPNIARELQRHLALNPSRA
jgi:hypothetical protein